MGFPLTGEKRAGEIQTSVPFRTICTLREYITRSSFAGGSCCLFWKGFQWSQRKHRLFQQSARANAHRYRPAAIGEHVVMGPEEDVPSLQWEPPCMLPLPHLRVFWSYAEPPCGAMVLLGHGKNFDRMDGCELEPHRG